MTGPRRRQRHGISLVEVMVAVTLLGLLATVHSAVTMQYALRNRAVTVGVDRAAALSTAVDLYATRPFAQIASDTVSGGCARITTVTRYIHDRCISTSNPTQAILRIQIIIRPENPILRPDTVRVDRSLPPSGSIFS
ncbi:MAG: hypothetical protein RLZZ63_1413 [Gemmatimonadota bacterium]|jgi:prepilin-type N-terminal cleavage/methylation domain-containing protein